MNIKKGKKGFIKTSTKQFVRRLGKEKPEYALLGSYKGYNAKHSFKHTPCGRKFECRGESIWKRNCIFCYPQKKVHHLTKEIVEHRLATDPKYTGWQLLDFEAGQFIHECGEVLEIRPGSFLSKPSTSSRRICVSCHGANGWCYSKREVEELLKGRFTLLSRKERKGRGSVYKLKHRKCGSILFKETPVGAKCLTCYSKRRKKVKVGGVRFVVDGIEDLALKLLEKRKFDMRKLKAHTFRKELGVKSKDLVPTIRYRFEGNYQTYHPDFYYPPRKLLIEVKDRYSFGLCGEFFGKKLFKRNQAKARFAMKNGYDFMMLVLSRSKPDCVMDLPENWFELKKREVRESPFVRC